MNILVSLIEFTSALLRISCQASVVIGLVLLVQWLFHKQLSPRWRYALWMVVLLRLALPVLPGSSFSIFNYTQAVPLLGRGLGEPEHSRADGPALTAPPPLPSYLQDGTVADSRNIKPGARTAPAARTPAASAGSAESPAVAPDGSRFTPPALHVCLSLLWLAGALFLAARIVVFPRRLNAELARHEMAAEPELFDVLEESKRQIDIQRVLPIVQSRAVKSPALLGFFRPWLLLPEAMAKRFSPQELRLVFLHELAHLKRRDIAVNWVMTFLQVLHWFNPLVWLTFHRIRADRELACDELALSHASEEDRKPYGQTMIKLVESFARPTAIAGLVGILEDKQQMKRRIRMIAEFKTTSAMSAGAATVLLALSLVSLTDAQTRTTEERVEADMPLVSSGLTLRELHHVPTRLNLGDLSPDGRYITTHRWNPPETGLFEPATGSARVLTNSVLPYQKFSPDGSMMIASQYDSDDLTNRIILNELVLFELESNASRRIYRNKELVWLKVTDWSTDGQTLLTVFQRSGHRWEIALVSIVDGSARILKSLGTRRPGVESLDFSPDCRWVVFDVALAAKVGEQRDVFILSSEGGQESPLVQHPAEDYLLGWVPSTDRVLFVSNRRGSWDAFALQVTDGEAIGAPELVKENIGLVSPMGLTRTGSFFYRVQARSSNVYVTELDPVSGRVQGTPIKVSERFEDHNRSPDWSPDGRFLAFVSARGWHPTAGLICIRDFATDTERELPSNAGLMTHPRWSPDSAAILASGFDEGRWRLYRIDAETGESVVLPAKQLNTSMFGWFPDGKSIYHQPKYSSVARHELESATEKLIKLADHVRTGALSPNGELFAFVSLYSDTKAIQIIPANGGDSRHLVEMAEPEFVVCLTWTPDSRYVVFGRKNVSNSGLTTICRVPAVGGEVEMLGLEMNGITELSMTLDGLAFTVASSKREIWVMENFLPAQQTAAE